MKRDPVHVLREYLGAPGLTDDARARIVRRLDEHVERTLRDEARATKRRLRMPRVAFGAVAAVAVMIALVVALAPGDDGGADSTGRVPAFVGPDTAVARELVRIGDVAADAPWGPLAKGEYFHLYSTSIPGNKTGGGMGPSSFEVWLDREGRGQNLSVMGAVDPSRYATMSPGGGAGYSTLPAKEPVPFEEMLANPNTVNLMEWGGRGDEGRQRAWIRTRKGFEQGHDSDNPKPGEPTAAGSTGDPERTMREYWGLTTKELDQLPDEGGPKMDAAVQELLDAFLEDHVWRSNRIPTGAFGVTAEQADREERIEYAVRLLGTAPLPPEARRSLYRWLARQQGASLEPGAKDALGRPGTRITFEHEFRDELPARRVTVAELLTAADEAGADIDTNAPVTMMDFPKTNEEMVRRQHEDFEVELDRSDSFFVPAHVETRTWRVVFIVDPDSGELRQWSTHAARNTDVEVPELARMHEGEGVQVINFQGGRQRGGRSEQQSGSFLYVSRGRATLDEPQTLVCNAHPEVCGLEK